MFSLFIGYVLSSGSLLGALQADATTQTELSFSWNSECESDTYRRADVSIQKVGSDWREIGELAPGVNMKSIVLSEVRLGDLVKVRVKHGDKTFTTHAFTYDGEESFELQGCALVETVQGSNGKERFYDEKGSAVVKVVLLVEEGYVTIKVLDDDNRPGLQFTAILGQEDFFLESLALGSGTISDCTKRALYEIQEAKYEPMQESRAPSIKIWGIAVGPPDFQPCTGTEVSFAEEVFNGRAWFMDGYWEDLNSINDIFVLAGNWDEARYGGEEGWTNDEAWEMCRHREKGVPKLYTPQSDEEANYVIDYLKQLNAPMSTNCWTDLSFDGHDLKWYSVGKNGRKEFTGTWAANQPEWGHIKASFQASDKTFYASPKTQEMHCVICQMRL